MSAESEEIERLQGELREARSKAELLERGLAESVAALEAAGVAGGIGSEALHAARMMQVPKMLTISEALRGVENALHDAFSANAASFATAKVGAEAFYRRALRFAAEPAGSAAEAIQGGTSLLSVVARNDAQDDRCGEAARPSVEAGGPEAAPPPVVPTPTTTTTTTTTQSLLGKFKRKP